MEWNGMEWNGLWAMGWLWAMGYGLSLNLRRVRWRAEVSRGDMGSIPAPLILAGPRGQPPAADLGENI